jgi:hypothetical protein
MAMRKFFLFALLVPFASRLFAADALLEYQVKAVCVLNAARFVSWPSSAFANADAPLVIGILGDNPFGSALQNVVAGETVHERRIVVRRVSLEEAATVHVLFISNSQRDHLAEILRKLGNASVLTISEIEGFTQNGGMVSLTLIRGKIRFDANADSAGRAQLKIDSQFLLLTRAR